ncbi:MAG: hypothetical protein M3340_05470, partial [Actinomycetota bacterium]|nr:hypothetical protein [Actinomycetota bacterium]
MAGDTTVVRVAYSGSGGNVRNRINALANVGGTPIVVAGVNSSFVFADTGVPVSQMAGRTFPSDGVRIAIIYDVTQCNNTGYFVHDTGGNQIVFPNSVLLFHELSHAFHLNAGTLAAAPEPQAITEENWLRSALAITLRDPNNHAGGCGFVPSMTAPGSGSTGGGCLVVTAAYGSPAAEQVVRLQSHRDGVLRRSLLVRDVFAQIDREYYQYSPRIARDMRLDPAYRHAISLLVVNPLMNGLREVALHVGTSRTPEESAAALGEVLASCVESLRAEGLDAAAIERLARTVRGVGARGAVDGARGSAGFEAEAHAALARLGRAMRGAPPGLACS